MMSLVHSKMFSSSDVGYRHDESLLIPCLVLVSTMVIEVMHV